MIDVYLLLLQALDLLNYLDRDYEADQLRDVMDTVWWGLTPEERDRVNAR